MPSERVDQDNLDRQPSAPNRKANRFRHSRVFRKTLFLRVSSLIPGFLRFRKRGTSDSSSFRRFIKQTVATGAAILVISSFAPTSLLEIGFSAEYFPDTDFILEEELPENSSLLISDDGFVQKTSPISSEEVNRIGFTDSAKHTVEPGETLSGIAQKYGLKTQTLIWGNNFDPDATLRVGQTLLVPPIDGVSHTVTSKDTLSSLSKKYGVDSNLIRTHNHLEGDSLGKGRTVFIPGGKRIEPPPTIARNSGRRDQRISQPANSFQNKVVMASTNSPSNGKKLIYPTDGNITQGFRRGHYALDIANRSKPDIWAAAAGTVKISAEGCHPREVKKEAKCNRGYGNYVSIDHGDGLETLYGHMETLYVSEGQKVERGQAIGKMGNTGRVYGTTGIHVHFEVIDDGVKKNPRNYF